MFLALARISSAISLNTLSLLLVFASSISSLHAVYSVSFIFVRFLLCLGVLVMVFLWANSLRYGNLDWQYEECYGLLFRFNIS